MGHQETTDLIRLIMDRTLLRYAEISDPQLLTIWQLEKNEIFTVKSACALILMIFGIQHLRILLLYSGKVYFLLKLRCLCNCCCRIVWVLRDFLPTEKLLVTMMLVVIFVIWKLRALITFLFIALLLWGSSLESLWIWYDECMLKTIY